MRDSTAQQSVPSDIEAITATARLRTESEAAQATTGKTFESHQAATTGSAREHSHLPEVTLTADRFAEVAKNAFKKVDANSDGMVQYDELQTAMFNPYSKESAETMQAIKIMYQHYSFLTHISTTASPLGTSGAILPGGLDKAQDIISGKIDANKSVLSTSARGQASSAFGAIGGVLSAPAAAYAGGAAAMELANLAGWGGVATWAAVDVGLAVGVVSGAALCIGAGLAVGYGIDYMYKKHHQKEEVSSLLNEFKPQAIGHSVPRISSTSLARQGTDLSW